MDPVKKNLDPNFTLSLFQDWRKPRPKLFQFITRLLDFTNRIICENSRGNSAILSTVLDRYRLVLPVKPTFRDKAYTDILSLLLL